MKMKLNLSKQWCANPNLYENKKHMSPVTDLKNTLPYQWHAGYDTKCGCSLVRMNWIVIGILWIWFEFEQSSCDFAHHWFKTSNTTHNILMYKTITCKLKPKILDHVKLVLFNHFTNAGSRLEIVPL